MSDSKPKIHRKPTGEIGPLSIRTAGVNWDKIRFPDEKISQEAKITSLFVTAMERSEDGLRLQVESLPEADHDARLIADGEEIDLQLKEIVIRPKRGNPYQSKTRRYDAGRFSDHLIEKIKQKRYASGGRPLWLLLYPTHWAFVPAPSVEFLLHNYFRSGSSPYDRVFLMHLLTTDHAELTGLYPTVTGQRAQSILAFRDEVTARAQDFVSADPSTAASIPAGLFLPIPI